MAHGFLLLFSEGFCFIKVCVENYIDVDPADGSWSDTLDDRLIDRPNGPPVIIVFASPTLTKQVLEHFATKLAISNQTFQFIITNFDDFYRDSEDVKQVKSCDETIE